MIYHYDKSDFKDYNKESLTLTDKGLVGSNGYMISDVIETQMFKSLLVSWNSISQGFIEVEVRVKSYKWSNWFTYGKWSDKGKNMGSVSKQSDDVATVYVDEVVCAQTCHAFQFRVWFSDGHSLLKRLSIAIKTSDQVKFHPITNVDIEVPKLSQMMIPDIGNIICSPASLSMVMMYYGKDVDVIDTSQGAFDNGASIYGNWSYNVAYAGERGFDAHVKYCYDTKDLLTYIQKGMPIVASIKTKTQEALKGSPQAYPSGHLVVIKGFEKDDKDYILVNDPASKTLEGVNRKYDLGEFIKAWNHVIYVIKPDKEIV